MRQLWLLVAVAGTGCNSLLGINELTAIDAGTSTADASAIDAAPMTVFDAPAGAECFGTLGIQTCFVRADVNPLTLTGAIDTGSDPRCIAVNQTAGDQVCAIIGSQITIQAITVTGTRPLALVASETIIVTGRIEAGSVGGGRLGPAADSAACVDPQAGATSITDAGGGGAGGSFGSVGNQGGDGAGGSGGNGATATPVQVPATLRGGCRGSAGGRGSQSNANQVGAGGHGGGALYLFAGTSITISEKIWVTGSGGSAANGQHCGGGGGGAGGMIILESPTIVLNNTGELNANGGGGGEGTRNNTADNGGESQVYNVGGSGGTGSSAEGGAGGIGATGLVIAGPGLNGVGGNGNEGGGGGGGGGRGVIWVKGTLTGSVTQVSPTAIPK